MRRRRPPEFPWPTSSRRRPLRPPAAPADSARREIDELRAQLAELRSQVQDLSDQQQRIRRGICGA